LGLLGLLILGRRQRPTPGPPATQKRLGKDRLLLAILIGGLLLRTWLLQVLALDAWEFEDLSGRGVGERLRDLAAVCDPDGSIRWNYYHAPLTGLIGGAFCAALDSLDVENSMAPLRALNLPLLICNIVLIRRMAERLGSPTAGQVTAALVAFAPAFVVIGSRFGPYGLEMTASLWFLEMLLPSLLGEGRPRHPARLAIAAALMIWTSYLSVLLVFPGLVALLLRARGRDDRAQALALGAVVMLLVAPVLESGAFAALDLGAATNLEPTLRKTIGGDAHPVFEETPRGIAAALLPLRLTQATVGLAGMLVTCAGWVLLLRRGPRWIMFWLGGTVVLFALVDGALFTRWSNYLSILPLMLLLGLVGWERSLSRRLSPRRLLVAALLLCMMGPTSTLVHQTIRTPMTVLASWASGRDTWFAITADVRREEQRSRPLSVYDPDRILNLHHLICGGGRSVNAMGACHDPRELRQIRDLSGAGADGGLVIVAAQREAAAPEDAPPACRPRILTPRIQLYDCAEE